MDLLGVDLIPPYLTVALTDAQVLPTDGTNYGVSICGLNLKIWGMLTQLVQNNKFVESGVKNWALMNWATANMILKGKLNITVDPNVYRFLVQGGSPYTKINRN